MEKIGNSVGNTVIAKSKNQIECFRNKHINLNTAIWIYLQIGSFRNSPYKYK